MKEGYVALNDKIIYLCLGGEWTSGHFFRLICQIHVRRLYLSMWNGLLVHDLMANG